MFIPLKLWYFHRYWSIAKASYGWELLLDSRPAENDCLRTSVESFGTTVQADASQKPETMPCQEANFQGFPDALAMIQAQHWCCHHIATTWKLVSQNIGCGSHDETRHCFEISSWYRQPLSFWRSFSSTTWPFGCSTCGWSSNFAVLGLIWWNAPTAVGPGCWRHLCHLAMLRFGSWI